MTDVTPTVGTPEVEPAVLFKNLKEGVKIIETEQLDKQLAVIEQQIVLAKEAGQKNFTDRLAVAHDIIVREQQLLIKGYKEFVYETDVETLLNKTKKIKIIELERYPRAIPLEVLEKYKAAKETGLFDKFVIVFTDLTAQEYKTEEEKQYVQRNRDPVLFGCFQHKVTAFKHDRFYFIADWEDAYCDLTFNKMIEEMAKVGVEKPKHEIGTDHIYAQELVRATLDDLNNKQALSVTPLYTTLDTPIVFNSKTKDEPKKSVWERLKAWRASDKK